MRSPPAGGSAKRSGAPATRRFTATTATPCSGTARRRAGRDTCGSGPGLVVSGPRPPGRAAQTGLIPVSQTRPGVGPVWALTPARARETEPEIAALAAARPAGSIEPAAGEAPALRLILRRIEITTFVELENRAVPERTMQVVGPLAGSASATGGCCAIKQNASRVANRVRELLAVSRRQTGPPLATPP